MAVTGAALETSTMTSRLAALRAAGARAGVDAVLVAPGSDLRYLIGIGGASYERLTTLVLPSDPAATPYFVVPKLEYAGLAHVPFDELGIEVRPWVDGENAYELALRGLGIGAQPGPLAFSDTTTALHLFALRDAGASDQRAAGSIVREQRMRKTEAELAELRTAGAAIDRVHARMGEWLEPGRTEREVGADIAAAIVEEGHAVAEFVIVGSGPNGSSPHHGLSDRVIEKGDVVVIDIGGPLPSGYCSDSTRTYSIGTPREPDVVEHYAALQASQQAAVDAVRPGVTCQDVDRAARQVLVDAGIDDRFIHRTGHGIGLDVHEEPYIVEGNDLPLEAGMTFSIEPCIVFAGRWGARIEDIVAVTADGVEQFNNRPRELVAL